MPDLSGLCVIIPCHNEAENVRRTLDDLQERLPGAFPLVVDDASDDATFSVALEDGRAAVLSLPTNIGVGGGLQAGFKYALAHGFTRAVKFDGDGQHRAEEIASLLEEMERSGANVVVGSRFLAETDGYKSTFLRRIGITLLNKTNSLLTGWRITDCTSGFRAYDLKAMRFLVRHYGSLDYPEPEEPVLLRKNGFLLTETPTAMNPRCFGSSSIKPLGSAYFMVKMLFCILMVALRSPERS